MTQSFLEACKNGNSNAVEANLNDLTAAQLQQGLLLATKSFLNKVSTTLKQTTIFLGGGSATKYNHNLSIETMEKYSTLTLTLLISYCLRIRCKSYLNPASCS